LSLSIWLLLALCLLPSAASAVENFTIKANKIERFQNRPLGYKVGKGLIWRGGLHLFSDHEDFGGLSDLTFTSDEGHLAMITDKGEMISAQLIYDENGAPKAMIDAQIERLRNSKGDKLPTIFSRDPEAIDTIFREGKAAAVRVGFEHLTRVADFEITNNRPGGAAREYPIPNWLTRQRHNGSIEALCIAPPASPIAGSTLIIAENVRDDQRNNKAWLSGSRDGGDLKIKADGAYKPTACQFTPNGDLLILNRDFGIFGFTMKLRFVPKDDVKADALLDGELILEASGGDIDNMEGLTTHIGERGETIISILSDDNFRGWERTLLLQFEMEK
jgi:hypothetical protein